MSVLSVVSRIAGAEACVMGDTEGNVLEQSETATQGETWAAAVALAGRSLSTAGAIIGLGAPQTLSSKCSDVCWIVAFHPKRLAVVRCDSSRSATNVESALTTTDWDSIDVAPDGRDRGIASDAPGRPSQAVTVSSSVVPATTEPNRVAPVGRPPLPPRMSVPRPAGTTARTTGVEGTERAPMLPRPQASQAVASRLPEKRDKTGSTAPRASMAGVRLSASHVPSATLVAAAAASSTGQALGAELRRALVRGQLAQAEAISQKIAEAIEANPRAPDMPTPAPRKLLDGIASFLAGDAFGGLVNLKTAEKAVANLPSLRWVATIWCVRASAAAGEGSDAALAFAESALGLGSSLDAEARAISTLELAWVEFQRGDHGQALTHARAARLQRGSAADPHLSATCWLLEARILAALGKLQESLDAAGKARDQRPSWPPPVTFIGRCALQAGRLDDASRALGPLLASRPIPTEIDSMNRVIEFARSRVISTEAAYAFLELVESPATVENVKQLEALSNLYPKVEQFRDAFGWRLLRTGQYDAAKRVFEQLCAQSDLSDEVRASVLLALGCLAAADERESKSVAKIRAAVDATPKQFKLRPPSPRAKIVTGTANPSEFRQSDAPIAPPETAGGESAPAPHWGSGRGAPMFSGSLQLFAIPDLLEFLRSGQRTGTLLCSSTAGIGAVEMRRGRIIGAASPKAKELKDYLLAMGFVTKERLSTADDSQRDNDTLIGDILVRSGIASAAQVRDALRAQIRDAIRDLMDWGAGKFAFDPEAPKGHSEPEIQIEVDPQETLLDIFKEMDEGEKGAS